MLVSSRKPCLLAQLLHAKQQNYDPKQNGTSGRSIPDHRKQLSKALSEDVLSTFVNILTVKMTCICGCGQNDSFQRFEMVTLAYTVSFGVPTSNN